MSTTNASTYRPDSAALPLLRGAAIDGVHAFVALVNEAQTDRLGFWARFAREHLTWRRPFTRVLDESNAPFFKWIADQLRAWFDKEIGPIAKPKEIRFGDSMPKTRSGKSVRRLLRSAAKGEAISQDVSTVENPAVLHQFSQHT